MSTNDFELEKRELRSETAKMLYGELAHSNPYQRQEAPKAAVSKPVEEQINPQIEEKEIPEQPATFDGTPAETKIEPIETEAEPEQKINLESMVDRQTEPANPEKSSGRAPSLTDFDRYYFETFFGIVGDKQAKYRTILNMINSTSMIYLGPSSGGKSALQDASRELLNGAAVTLNDSSDVDDALTPEKTNGKVWYSPELQILLRGSKNQKDVVKLLSNHEDYKGMKIEFFVTSAAFENDYFQKFIVSNKELMRRLDIIDVESSFGKVKTIRDSITKTRMEGALAESPDEFTKEHFREWVNHWRNLKLDAVIDPFCAFHDQYFVLSFKSFDPIKRYHKLEDAMLKMKLEESTYQLDSKDVHILSIREKYRADNFRKNINQTLEKIDDAETIRKYYGWTDEELKAYQKSVEKSKENVDWQACWESGLESLRQAHQKGLLPASLISEYINRHVINGKVTVIDDYTGKEVVLAEHPRAKHIEREVIVITNLERMIDEPQELCEPAQRRIILPAKQQLCLPPGDYNGNNNRET